MDLIFFILLLIAIFCIGITIGERIQAASWKKLLIQKGFAQYNSVTGKWEWK